MKKSREPIEEALQPIRPTALQDPAAGAESSAPRSDLAELLLVELQGRRERLQQWLQMISEEAAGDFSLSSSPRKPARKCRSRESGPRTARIGRTQNALSRRAPREWH